MPVELSVEGGVAVDVDRVEADAGRLLIAVGSPDAELSIVLCDDATIAPINRDWRDIDAPTDVLSFPQDDDEVLGDIVISVETAARQAAELGHDVDTELRVLLVHGLCHLLGHDHHEPDETRAMQEEERRLLAALAEGAPGLVQRASS